MGGSVAQQDRATECVHTRTSWVKIPSSPICFLQDGVLTEGDIYKVKH